MKYKKGQIVPRRLVRCKSRKTQHTIVFGADVDITGRSITALSDGSVLIFTKSHIGGQKKKPKILIRALVNDISIIGLTDNNNALFVKEAIELISHDT
jgi:hypothetical protein